MRAISSILGQDTVSKGICADLKSGSRTAIIFGREGTGKTKTAELILDAMGEEFGVVKRAGQKLLSSTQEAMLVGIDVRNTRQPDSNAVIDAAQDLADLVEDGHIPFSRTLRRLFKRGVDRNRKKLLSQRKQDFLQQVASAKDRGKTIIIADNAHYWDNESLIFLAQIHSGIWDALYPGLLQTKIILVWTTDQSETGFEQRLDELFSENVPRYELLRVQREHFNELLLALGAPEDLPSDTANELYAISGSHLKLVSELVALLRTNRDSLPSVISNSKTSGTLLKQMIEVRLNEAGSVSDLLRKLLNALCVIGENATFIDLECLLRDQKELILDVIAAGTNLGLVKSNANATAIAHDVIRRVFLEFLAPEQKEWHQKFAECWVKIRPSDFGRRAIHLATGGQEDKAEIARVMDLLQAYREQRVTSEENWASLVSPLSETTEALVGTIQKASSLGDARQYEAAIRLLDDTWAPAGEILDAERDYVLARLLILVRTENAQIRALGLVEDIANLEKIEPDLWRRMEEVRLLLLGNLGQLDAARKTELQLRKHYEKSYAFEFSAAIGLTRLRRVSDSIHSPKVSNDRLKKALRFVDPTGDGTSVRDVEEYVLCLNNLGANEMVLGNFGRAHELLVRCWNYVGRIEEPVIRRPEIILSNVLVADYLCAGVVTREIGPLTEVVKTIHSLSSDGILLRSNLGGLLIASGHLVTAKDYLLQCVHDIDGVTDVFAYPRYHLFSNLSLVHWLQKKPWQKDWENAEQAAEEVGGTLALFAKKRGDVVSQLFRDRKTPRSLKTIQDGLQKLPAQLGPEWSLYGQAIVFSDLQFWSGS